MQSNDTLDAIAAIAAYGLSGSQRTLPRSPLEPAEWKALLGGVRNQRITGFLVRAIDDDALVTTAEQRVAAARAHAEARCLVLLLEQHLTKMIDCLEGEGIDYRILKGPAVARLAYSAPWLRSYGDIDLLVPTQQFELVARLLGGLGYRPDRPPPRPGFYGRFGKGVTFFSAAGFPVDLHRSLAEGPFAQQIRQRELLVQSSTFVVGGQKARGLGCEENFMHACLHAVLGDAPARLVPLRDLAQMLQTTELDVDRVLRLSSSWKTDAVVAGAICTAWSVFQLVDHVPLSDWAHHFRPTRSQQRTLRLYPKTAGNYALLALAELPAIPGLCAKASYLRAMLLPDSSYLEAGSGGHLRRWRLGARSVMPGTNGVSKQ